MYLKTLNIYYFFKNIIDMIDSIQQLNMHKIYIICAVNIIHVTIHTHKYEAG